MPAKEIKSQAASVDSTNSDAQNIVSGEKLLKCKIHLMFSFIIEMEGEIGENKCTFINLLFHK